MIRTGREPRGVAGLAAGTLQTAMGVAAHTVAAGCLPAASTLVLAAPAAVAGVAALSRLLPDRPLLRLAGGQLTVHAVLAATACVGTATGAGSHGSASVAMTFAHVAALVLCRALLGAVVRTADRAAARVLRVVRRARLVAVGLPPFPRVPVARRTAPRCRTTVRASASRRGPPRTTARSAALLPA